MRGIKNEITNEFRMDINPVYDTTPLQEEVAYYDLTKK